MAASAPWRSGAIVIIRSRPPAAVTSSSMTSAVGIGHELRVLGTAAGGGQERPFGVNSGDVAAQRRVSLVEQPADPPGRSDEVVGRRRHEAEQRRRRPVAEMELARHQRRRRGRRQ